MIFRFDPSLMPVLQVGMGGDMDRAALTSLGLGEGSEAQAPLAIVIIGGLAVSTIITLVFVPVVYTLLDDLGIWVKSRVTKVLHVA
ncbi:MAG: efflux RND transporter permease subunit [Bacillota bacterium]